MNHLKRCYYTLLLGFSLFFSLAMSGCTPLIAGGVTASSAAYVYINHHRSWPTRKTDTRIHQQLQQAFASKLDSSDNIRIVVFQQNLLLLGQVQSAETKKQLQQIAQQNDHVESIYNELVVAPPSSYFNSLHNKWLTTKINTALWHNKALTNTPFATITNNGTIYLLGNDLASGQVEVIRNNIADIEGVKKIIYLKDSKESALTQKRHKENDYENFSNYQPSD